MENNELKDIKHIGPKRNPICYFGNIWIRHHKYQKGEGNGGGHKHYFDHVTMLASGSVLVEIDGYKPKQFDGPTFILIEKEHNHKITALTDNVVYYCVYALRDVNGEVTDIYSGDNHPYMNAPDDYWTQQSLQKLDDDTTHEH